MNMNILMILGSLSKLIYTKTSTGTHKMFNKLIIKITQPGAYVLYCSINVK